MHPRYYFWKNEHILSLAIVNNTIYRGLSEKNQESSLLFNGKEEKYKSGATYSCVHVYALIISKYATKIVGTQKRQIACVHGTQSTFNTVKPAQ